jgi:hypothetical protein
MNEFEEVHDFLKSSTKEAKLEKTPEEMEIFYELVNLWIADTNGEGYFDDWLAQNDIDCYNRRRKTMTFLRSKNAGTESELSVARRTKVPALGSWM